MSIRLLGFVVLGVAVTACGYRAREQSLTPADLRVPERTRISNYMSAPLRPGSPSEEPPTPAISRSSILDEARISKISADEVCFDLLVRTGAEKDTAISEMRILVDGMQARASDESLEVRDYGYAGERDVLVGSFASQSAISSLRLTAPVEHVFRVMERRAQVCRTMVQPSYGELSLEVILVQDDNRGNWGEKFVWRVE